MPVYKLSMKIFKKNIPSLLIYLFVFLFVSMIMSSSASSAQKEQHGFSRAKTNIAFINEENSVFIEGLKEELSKVANFVDLPDEKEALQDALFFRRVKYILRVPEGFTKGFMSGENVSLEKTIVSASTSSAYLDLSVEKYLNNAKTYVNNIDDLTQSELVAYLRADFSKESSVEISTTEQKPDLIYSNLFYNYLAYSLLAILIYGMSSLLLSFNKSEIKSRVACAPITDNSVNIQFALANLTFAIVSWIIMVLCCMVVDYKNINTMNTVYFLINSFVFTICGSGLAFLIGSIAKGSEAISAITNVVVLGTSFISGVFVSADLLGSAILKIASYMPTYWYVKANNQIAILSHFDYGSLKPILSDIMVVMLFGIAFFALAMVIRKRRRWEVSAS